MATQNPISTISYNSESFLREKLEGFRKAHIIQSYMYICHKGEDGDKDHIHLRIEPNKRIDPMDISDELTEYTRDSVKPLKCRPFRQSKEEDWILYAVHDAAYLATKDDPSKGEKIPYDWTDIKSNEDFDIEIAYVRAKAAQKHSSVSLATSLQNGSNPVDLILQGESPFLVSTLMKALYGTDYTRLASDYRELKDAHNELVELLNGILALIDKVDLKIVQDDNCKPSLCLKDGTILAVLD